MRTTTLAIVLSASALLCGCQTAPTSSAAVIARTVVIQPDGYGRTTRSVIGPDIVVTVASDPNIVAHLALANDDEIWILCVASTNRVPPNSMMSAFADDGKRLSLVRLSHDTVKPQAGVDRFTIVIPRTLTNEKIRTGLRLKLYGTRIETSIEIPTWYLEGFLNVVSG